MQPIEDEKIVATKYWIPLQIMHYLDNVSKQNHLQISHFKHLSSHKQFNVYEIQYKGLKDIIF